MGYFSDDGVDCGVVNVVLVGFFSWNVTPSPGNVDDGVVLVGMCHVGVVDDCWP